MKEKDERQELLLQDLRELAKKLDLEEEFDDIEAEVCNFCCVIFGGGGSVC